MTKVLIVEDEITIANDLEGIIEDGGLSVAGIAYTGTQAIDMLNSRSPDIILLDIALKGPMSGLDVADIVNSKYALPIVFVTSFADQATLAQIASRHPAGYIAKPFKEKDIIPAITLALSSRLSTTALAFPSLDSINDQLEIPLTKYEYQVIHEVFKGKSNSAIAEDLCLSINTIKTHLSKVYIKLEVKSRSEAISSLIKVKQS